MQVIKTVFISLCGAAGFLAIPSLLALILPMRIEATLCIRGDHALAGVRLFPFGIGPGLGFSQSIAHDRELGLVFCGNDSKRFGKPVKIPNANARAVSVAKIAAGSLKHSLSVRSFAAIGTIAARESPDRAVLAAGALRAAAAMLVSAFPNVEAGFCIAPDLASGTTKADISCIAALNTGKLVMGTIGAIIKGKGDKK